MWHRAQFDHIVKIDGVDEEWLTDLMKHIHNTNMIVPVTLLYSTVPEFTIRNNIHMAILNMAKNYRLIFNRPEQLDCCLAFIKIMLYYNNDLYKDTESLHALLSELMRAKDQPLSVLINCITLGTIVSNEGKCDWYLLIIKYMKQFPENIKLVQGGYTLLGNIILHDRNDPRKWFQHVQFDTLYRTNDLLTHQMGMRLFHIMARRGCDLSSTLHIKHVIHSFDTHYTDGHIANSVSSYFKCMKDNMGDTNISLLAFQSMRLEAAFLLLTCHPTRNVLLQAASREERNVP